MRKTVTLDQDVERLLREAMLLCRQSFQHPVSGLAGDRGRKP